MELVSIKSLFTISYGNQIDLNKLTSVSDVSETRVAFVSRTSENNGVSDWVRPVEGLDIYPKGVLTATLGGTYLLSVFLQQQPFYTAQNIKVLYPKYKMSMKEKLVACSLIRHNRFRYTSHGREANKTFDDINIPSLEYIKNIASKFILTQKPKKEPCLNKTVSLDDKEWECFDLRDFFSIAGTNSYTKEEMNEHGAGRFPYVVTSSKNNGIQGFYGHSEEEGGVLTIDSATVGSCFYQPLDFSASAHVEKLIPKFNMTAYIAMFMQTIIGCEKFRYGYGRKYAQMRIKKTKIKLPADKNGNPDWQFMEDYIKSLPYSSNL